MVEHIASLPHRETATRGGNTMSHEMREFRFSRVPCEAKDFNTGRCRIAPKLMEEIGGILNSHVQIATESEITFCNLWPRSDGQEHVIQFDTLVTLPNREKGNQSGDAFPKKNIPLKSVTVIKPLEAKCVVTELTLTNLADEIDGEYVQDSIGEKVLQRLLKGCVVVKGCEIRPKELRNIPKSSRGIAKVLVISTEPMTRSVKDTAVLINERTQISVRSVKRGEILQSNDNMQVLAGLDDISRELREILSYPFQYPDCFDCLGLQCPKGILLQGAPGVGKTLLVKTVTSQCNAQLVTLNGTDIFGPHQGESEENLRKIFENAR